MYLVQPLMSVPTDESIFFVCCFGLLTSLHVEGRPGMASRGHKESNGSGKLHDDNVNKIIIILQTARTNPVEKYSTILYLLF